MEFNFKTITVNGFITHTASDSALKSPMPVSYGSSFFRVKLCCFTLQKRAFPLISTR